VAVSCSGASSGELRAIGKLVTSVSSGGARKLRGGHRQLRLPHLLREAQSALRNFNSGMVKMSGAPVLIAPAALTGASYHAANRPLCREVLTPLKSGAWRRFNDLASAGHSRPLGRFGSRQSLYRGFAAHSELRVRRRQPPAWTKA
jgi:hypothetical protein